MPTRRTSVVIDEELLGSVREALGTKTVKETTRKRSSKCCAPRRDVRKLRRWQIWMVWSYTIRASWGGHGDTEQEVVDRPERSSTCVGASTTRPSQGGSRRSLPDSTRPVPGQPREADDVRSVKTTLSPARSVGQLRAPPHVRYFVTSRFGRSKFLYPTLLSRTRLPVEQPPVGTAFLSRAAQCSVPSISAVSGALRWHCAGRACHALPRTSRTPLPVVPPPPAAHRSRQDAAQVRW